MITKHLQNITLTEEEEFVQMEVECEALPVAEWKWFVNNVEVHNSHTVRIMPDKNHCIATFHKPKRGEYVVVARNYLGQDTSRATLTVKREFNLFRLI